MSNQRFALDPDGFSRLNAKLLYVSTAKYEGDWHCTPHTHYFTEFFYVLKGKGNFLVENETFAVQENDLIIVNPNVAHTEKSHLNSPLEYIVLGVDGICFSFGDVNPSDTHHLFHFHNREWETSLAYLQMLLREAETDQPYREALCQDLLDVIIIHLFRHTDFDLSVVSSKKASLACGVAKRYIDSHYQEAISLEDLARMTHVSKFYLAHSFTEDYGLSPINYLIAKRVEESKNLLRDTNHSISQIASFTGFSSQSYFSQTFKKLTGHKPGDYRRHVRLGREQREGEEK